MNASLITEERRIVTKRLRDRPDDSWTIDAALATGGYETLRAVLAKGDPADVQEQVKVSGLRGRGGANFACGQKWSFLPAGSFPRYLVVNGDEGEPSTFKDRMLVERDPHQLVEGIIISAYAIQCNLAFVYLRGEFALGYDRLTGALADARAHGFLGTNILGSGFDLEIVVHRGAGAYICGEETALLESLEGERGMPRLKPPFPAVEGLYAKPTVVNNVETMANLPHILRRGVEWFTKIGSPPKSPGTRIFSVSGHVKRPGNYEVPMGITFRELIYDLAGGMKSDRPMKAFIPGGASASFFTPDHLDVKMDFDEVAKAGSMLGSGGVTVMDDSVCMVWAAANLMRFFHHESCGKCTPCREGSNWLLRVLRRIEYGQGRLSDLELLPQVCGNIAGRTVCAFGDAETAPALSTLRHFRAEYEAHITRKECVMGHATQSSSVGTSVHPVSFGGH